ncbi:hypothetical protein JL722_15176 [Aureococcus anophagefferens]|nr:hypothetical protein JL722_15176 [Aureococcus anophagefferens]
MLRRSVLAAPCAPHAPASTPSLVDDASIASPSIADDASIDDASIADDDASLSLLPAPLLSDDAANRCPVVKLPRFLSVAEVAAIHAFADELLAKLLGAARAADAATFGDFGRGAVLRPRVVEYHRVRRGGELRHEHHVDSGSCYTVDCMLARPDADFSGGDFVAEGLEGRAFDDLGDVVVFPSHKRHNVRPVTRGAERVGRRVLDGAGARLRPRCSARPCARAAVAAQWRALGELDEDDAAAARRFLRGRTMLC